MVIKTGLSQFLQNVYSFDLTKFEDNYYNDAWQFEEYGFGDEETYVDYLSNIFKKVRSYIEEKIIDDIKYLDDFYEDDFPEICWEELNITFDWSADTITFDGDYNKLAIAIVECINGYGLFYYENVEQLFSSIPAKTEEEKLQCVIDHLHWLRYFDEIYGACRSCFNSKSIVSYADYLFQYC